MGRDVLDMVRATVGRHGTVDDIAPVIAFLASDASAYVTGQAINLAGGTVMH